MRIVLVGFSLLLTVLIVGFLIQKNPKLEPVAMRTETQLEPSKPEVVSFGPKVEAVYEPQKTLMPEPVCIVTAQGAAVISDDKLRRFVGRNAIFGRDKVLYFEWQGGSEDKMEGTTVSDLETRDKRYVVTLKQTQGETMFHRQVFIIPQNYTYEVEISK